MQIIVTQQTKLVLSVRVEQAGDTLSVSVNTVNRWEQFHRQGGSPHIAADSLTKRVPVHQYFLIGQAELTLIAQNEAEAKTLDQLCYVKQNKEEIDFLFTSPKAQREIALWQV